MQQRVPVKHYTSHEAALADKKILSIKNPDVTYQIRRKHNGFDLVRRFSTNKINSYEESHAKKRISSKRRREISTEFLSEVRKNTRP